MKVFIGWDAREVSAYNVAQKTLRETSGIEGTPLIAENLRSQGLYDRPVLTQGNVSHDINSNAPCSTEFAATRFLTPILAQSGWALFADCDVVFLKDVHAMLDEVDPGKAVYVVKHNQTGNGTKMDGQPQTQYPRKNWSSVMLFNCDHQANRRLTLQDVNRRPGRELHAFYWLHDDEIGELSPQWNWLVNVEQKPNEVGIAHFTLGGPWLHGWKPQPHNHIWEHAANG